MSYDDVKTKYQGLGKEECKPFFIFHFSLSEILQVQKQ